MERFLPRLRMPFARIWTTLLFTLLSLVTFAQLPFITTWKTDNPGESITIPVNPDITGYNYIVEWGDGNTSTVQTGDASHTYGAAGTYTVSITGNFPAIHLGLNGTDVTDKLMSVEQWGDMPWASMERAFQGASNMVLNATDVPNLSGVLSLARMFDGASSLNSDLSGWNVSSVTDMSLMFNGASAFNGNISGWNVSNVTNMYGMFWYAGDFNQDIGGWNVSQVADMGYMFYSAADFNQDLSGWVTSNVTNMEGMFSFILGFDQSLGNWDISSVTTMKDMLLATGLSPENYSATLIDWAPRSVQSGVTLDAPSLTYCPGTDVANAIQQLESKGWTINDAGVAADCSGGGMVGAFITTWKTDNPGENIIIPVNPAVSGYIYTVDWGDGNTSVGQTGDATHTYASAGTFTVSITGDFPALYQPGPQLLSIDQWGDVAWKSMEMAFMMTDNLEIRATDLPNLSGVTSMVAMFRSATNFNEDVSAWDVSSVENMEEMFAGATSFNSDLSGWNTSRVTNMARMFSGASSFNRDLSSLDVSAVENMEEMFLMATSYNGGLSGWNTSRVTNMARMFRSAPSFNQNLSSWDVSAVENMEEMFLLATSFNGDLSGWNTSRVTSMARMFRGASSFNRDLSSWDVSAVENMEEMFYTATSFNGDLSDWTPSRVTNMTRMLNDSGLSTANYDATLIGWAAQSGLQSGLSFGASGVTYCAGADARQQLIDDHGWEITDGGEAADCGGGIVPDENNILYVNTDVNIAATGYTGSGDSWENAIHELADALKWAREQHDGGSPGWSETEPLRIFVAKGVYKPLYNAADGAYASDGGRDNSFVLVPNVQVYGGFDPSAGIESLDDDRILPNMNMPGEGSILSGDFNNNDHTDNYDNHTENAYHVTIASGDIGGALMDGFTVTGGYARGNTSGLSVMGRTVYRFFGGGTYVITSSPQFTHIAWFNNVGEWGGGLYNTVSLLTQISAPKLSNVAFYRNMAPGGGGGIRNFGGSVDIKQAIFAHNGAGLVEDPTSSGPGGGIHSSGDGTSLSVTNATFYGNWIVGVLFPNLNGGAIYVDGTSARLNNVVIWSNEVNGDPSDPAASIFVSTYGSDVTIANSLVAHSGGSANWNNAMGILDGGGNIDTDPVFVNTAPGEAGFLQLSACSPAVSAGSNRVYTDAGGDVANDLDLSGNPRVYNLAGGGVIDMGAYEYQGERLYIAQLTMPDAVQVAYGTAMEDVEDLPTTVTATLSDDTDISIPLDDNLANWTLASPAGGAYDGVVAGTYVFTVPLLIPETECYLNPENLAAEVTIVVAKGTPVLTALWNGTPIDLAEGFSLTYGNDGELALSTTDTDGELTYAFGDDDVQVLDLADLDAVVAQQVGAATLTIAQEETDNYEAASVEIAVTVVPKAITVVAEPDQGKVYGVNEPATYGYELANADALAFDDELMDIVSAVSREVGEDVGAYDIQLVFGGNQAGNYTITFEADNNAFTVTPLTITVMATDKSKVFGFDDPALTYTFAPELIGDDVFTGGLDREEGENVGTYAITQGNLALGDNYELTFEEGSLTITPAEYEGIEFDNRSFIYDGAEHTLGLIGELPTGTTVVYEIDGEAGNGATEAGTYIITALIAGGTNYEDAELTATLTITALNITVTADDKSKAFGSDDPALTYVFTPALIGDDTFTGGLDREEGENVGTYAITQGNLALGDNYEITFEGGTLTIMSGGYEDVILNDLSFTYDGTEHTLTLTGDLPEGASVVYEIEGERGNGANDVGIYEVTALIDGGDNYEDLTLTATLTIEPLAVMVMAADRTKVFGTSDPALTYTTSPELIGDDTFTGALTREEGEDVGEYVITQGNLTAGDNYAISFVRASFMITPRVSLPITGIAFDDTIFPYDGTARHLAIAGKLPEGVTVTYDGNGRTNTGIQEVTATMAGDGYETLVLTATLEVIPAVRTLDFPVLPEKTYGDADFEAVAIASSGESVSYTSSNSSVAEIAADGTITIMGAGETTITATVPENSNFTSRPQVNRLLTVNKALQVITLTAPSEVDRDAGTAALTATSSSGLPIELVVDDIEVASLNGTMLNILRLGTVRIMATQEGDANHEAADPVQVTIRVVDPSSELPVRVHPVISPNGDGINEFLMIEAIPDYPENRVTIFNRNGTLLWEASGYDNNRIAFRGMSTGQLLLPAGTYFYLVEVKDGNTWKHTKGYFVLRY